MMATQAEPQTDAQPNQKVTVSKAPDSPVASSESSQDHNQEVPEFSEKEFPALHSPNSESSKDSDLKDHDSKDHDSEAKLLDRINSIPMVAEGVNFVKGFVKDDSKPYSKYIKYAFTTAESAIHSATEIVETHFPNQVSAADHLASKSLDYLEVQFPVVFHQSSSEVYETSRKAISDIVASPTAAIDSTLVTVANSAEAVLDRLLPPTSDEEEVGESGIARLRHVGVDAQRRVIKVVRDQYENISSVTTSGSILHIPETNAYIQKANEEIASINERLSLLVNRTKESLENLKDSSLHVIKDTQNNLFQTLNSEMDTVSKYIQESSNKLPESIRSQIEPTVKFLSESVTKITQEIKREDQTPVQKAKNLINLATESIPYLDQTRDYFASFLVKKDTEVNAKN